MDQVALFAPPPVAEGVARFLGTCRRDDCRRVVAVEVESRAIGTWGECPAGHGRVYLERVRGTRTDAPCNSACMYARGPSCECGCGGANHGGGYVLR